MSADRPRASELRLRVMAGESLSASEEEELLKALSSDDALRAELEKDEQLDGILRVLGRGDEDAQTFAREFIHREAAERDKVRFAQGIRIRIEEEASRPPLRHTTRHGRRRPAPKSSRGPWLSALAAAGMLIGLLMLATFSKPARNGTRRPDAAPREEVALRTRAKEDRTSARAERLRVERKLDEIERERRRLEEERAKADREKQDELRRRAEEDLAQIAADHKAAAERLKRAQEAEQKAQDALTRGRPPAPPDAPTRVMRAVIARLDRVGGEVFVVSEGNADIAREGQELLAGQGLDVRGPGGGAVVVFPDKTRVEILAEAEVRDLGTERGKKLVLERGTLRAEVTPQPQDQPLVILTPHAEAKVLGTTLRLLVDPNKTRLDVMEGKVRLTRKPDGRSVDVASGHYAVAAVGVEPAVKAVPPDTPAVRLLESAGVVTVNFGPEGMTLPDQILNDSGEEFDAKRGYGWKGPKEGPELPGVFWKDQGGRILSKIRAGRGAAVHPTFPDPLRGSCVAGGWSNHAETWMMPVPNGRYLVTVCVGYTGQGEGSVGWEQGPHHVWVEGKQVMNAVLTKMNRPFVEQKDVPVEVRDGELTLRIGGYGGTRTSLDGSCDTILNFLVIRKAP